MEGDCHLALSSGNHESRYKIRCLPGTVLFVLCAVNCMLLYHTDHYLSEADVSCVILAHARLSLMIFQLCSHCHVCISHFPFSFRKLNYKENLHFGARDKTYLGELLSRLNGNPILLLYSLMYSPPKSNTVFVPAVCVWCQRVEVEVWDLMELTVQVSWLENKNWKAERQIYLSDIILLCILTAKQASICVNILCKYEYHWSEITFRCSNDAIMTKSKERPSDWLACLILCWNLSTWTACDHWTLVWNDALKKKLMLIIFAAKH